MRCALSILALLVCGCAPAPGEAPAPSGDRIPPTAGSPDTLSGSDARDEGPICTDVAYAGLIITVLDDTSGEPLSGDVTGVAREGVYADTLTFYRDYRPALDQATVSMLSGVFERPGTYSITVRHPDYHPWQRDTVTVSSDPCHVIPRKFEARLLPLRP